MHLYDLVGIYMDSYSFIYVFYEFNMISFDLYVVSERVLCISLSIYIYLF